MMMKNLSKNNIVKWLDEVGIETSACARKFSLRLRHYDDNDEVTFDPGVCCSGSPWPHLGQVLRLSFKDWLKSENEFRKTSYNTVAKSGPELETS